MLFLRVLAALSCRWRSRLASSRGQATTEYVLVLLGVAAIALAVTAWATSTGKIGELIDRVFDSITSQIT